MNKKYGDELNNLEKDLLRYIEKNISSKGVWISETLPRLVNTNL